MDPDFRAEVRRLVLTDELLALPEEVNELVNPIWEFVAAQREHFEIPRRREEILREHSTILHQYSEQLPALAKTKENEQHERQIIYRDPTIFSGRQGRPPDNSRAAEVDQTSLHPSGGKG
jgi:hypothetical protein